MPRRLSCNTAHKEAIRSLFRNLLRKCYSIDFKKVSELSLQYGNENLQREITRARINAGEYSAYISFEIKLLIKEEFKIPVKNPQRYNQEIWGRLNQGFTLIEIMDKVNGKDPGSIKHLMEFLLRHREHKRIEASWKAEKYKARYEIKNTKDRQQSKNFEPLSMNDKRKFIKHKRYESYCNSASILSRYLRLLQQNNLIPVAHLLPYTSDTNILPPSYTTSTSKYVSGTLSISKIEEAYDMPYIESVVLPGLEYDINFHHYLKELAQIVEEKGPFRVQIEVTEAGPMSVPYIRLPYPTLSKMKEVGLDIKKLMDISRVINVWEYTRESGRTVSESRSSDGSYAVQKSNGFGPNENMHTKGYYENLAYGEGLWECLINKRISASLPVSLQNSVEEWMWCLDKSSEILEARLQTFFDKYNYLRSKDSPLLNDQKILQQKMNLHYNDQVQRFDRILRLINEQNVFKHSEIVNSRQPIKKKYRDYLLRADKVKIMKKKKGLPMLERVGMGKTLGDYLDDAKFRYFKWGMKLDRKLRCDW